MELVENRPMKRALEALSSTSLLKHYKTGHLPKEIEVHIEVCNA